MKQIISIFSFLVLGAILQPVAAGASAGAVHCSIYDAATGTKLNVSAGKIVSGKCIVEINTDAISSSSTQLLIEVTLDNGAKLKALEEEAAAKFLSGKKEVTSSVDASSSGQVAYYQGLAAGGASCLAQAAATSLSSNCLNAMRFKSLSEMVSNLKGDSSTSGQSMNAMAAMMRGFLNNGGSDGTKDPVEFLKRLNDGDSSFMNRASDLARAGGGSTTADAIQQNFLLMQKVGQIAGTALQDKTVQEKFGQDAVYKQKYFDFFKSFDSADQAIKMAAAGAPALKSFFSDGDSFKATNPAAARELFIKEAESNFTGLNDKDKAQALFKTLAATDYNGKSIDEIKNGVSFLSGYVRYASDPMAVLENKRAIAEFVEKNSGTIERDKLNSQYFETCRHGIEQKQFAWKGPYEGFDRMPDIAVTSFSPGSQTTNLLGSIIGVRFDRDIDPASAVPENFLVHCLKGEIEGRVVYRPEVREVVWFPLVPFPAGSTCYAKMTGIHAVGSTTIPTTAWGWNMERAPFQVVSIYPQAGAVDVPPNSQIRVRFNAPIDPTFLQTAIIMRSCTYEGTFSIASDGKELIYSPRKSFGAKGPRAGSDCQIEISSSLRDIFGRTLGPVALTPFSLANKKDNAPPAFNGVASALAQSDSTTLRLFWNTATEESAGPVFYDAYCGEGPGREDFSKPAASVAGDTALDVYELTPDRPICCVVRARDIAGNATANREERCATTLAPPPYYFYGYPGRSGEIRLTWSMAPNALGYNLYIRRSGGAGWLLLPSTQNPVYSVTGLHSGAYYDFKIAAVTANGQGGLSSMAFLQAP